LARIGKRGVKPLLKSLPLFFKITGNKRASKRGEASLTYSILHFLLRTEMLEESGREAKPPNMLIGSFRGTKSLSHYLPLPLIKGKGDKGGWGFSTKGSEV